MIVGDWARRLPPVPGELLSSCLARNAYAHGSTPYRFLNMFWEHDPVWSRDFDRDPGSLLRVDRSEGATDWLDDLAERLGVPRQAVAEATLAGWCERLDGRSAGQACDTPLLLSAGVFHRVRTRHALQFCPDCLLEGVQHFRKSWRLGFTVACKVHSRALLDACTWCDAAVIPHRSMTVSLADCHRCGRSIAGRSERWPVQIPARVVGLQERLFSILQGDEEVEAGQVDPKEAFPTVRTLLAASTPPAVHRVLRGALGLGDDSTDETERRRFEHARFAVRLPWLETVEAWMRDWPRSFRDGADAAGMTQRTFGRRHLPAGLAAEVARLPVGVTRDRTWVPILEEPVLKRLRRRDPSAYRAERARRIMAATGRP